MIETWSYGSLINLRSRRKKIGSGEDGVVCAEQRTRAIEFPMVSLYYIIALSTSVHSEGYASRRSQQWGHPRGPCESYRRRVLWVARTIGGFDQTHATPRSGRTQKILLGDTNAMITTIYFRIFLLDIVRSFAQSFYCESIMPFTRVSREKY